jgi:cation:H+ antiporter
MTVGSFVLGFALLVIGAELLVRGASRLALRVGISPLAIGLTLVAFGTSSPELAVSVQAGLAGQADIAVANIVGSNIFNVLFILGLAALILPLGVSRQLVRVDVPLMIGASALFWIMALDGRIGRLDGLLLAAGIVAYTLFALWQGRQASPAVKDQYAQEFGAGYLFTAETQRTQRKSVSELNQNPKAVESSHQESSAKSAPLRWIRDTLNMYGADGWLGRLPVQLILIAGSLVLLALGARWLVEGAVAIARVLGVSEVVIGLTIVAAGTSLPEVATSVVAALRGARDIAIGNVVGSNIFNILSIGSIAALVTPSGLEVAPTLVRLDLPVMTAVAFACLPIFATGHRIARWEGGLFLGYYVAYVAFLILAATQHAALPLFSGAMSFALPLTGMTLVVLWARQRG